MKGKVVGKEIESVGIKPIIDRTTLLVYWYLLENAKSGVSARRLQRALGFKSPSSAIFHLEKLLDAQLVYKERSGEYLPLKQVKFGIMRYFILVRNRFLPKVLFYALALSIIVTIIGIFGNKSIEMFLALLPSLIAIAILSFQTLEVWRMRPKFHKVQ